MIFPNHLIHIALFSTLILSACATTPTSPPENHVSQTSKHTKPQKNKPDPLQTAEYWLKTGQSLQNLPIHTDFHTQTQSWNSPHVTRLYLASPDEYHAIITPQNEPPDHTLQLTIIQQENIWTITDIQPTPARHLWPRF